MSKSDEEREFRLRPGKPKVSNRSSDKVAWTSGFKMLMHYARQSSSGKAGSGTKPSRPYRQRCAVRITYSKNTVRGHWRAHGRYLERESATEAETAFNAEEAEAQISSRLQQWQSEKDQLLWKFIISPEFGDRADLQKLTKDLMRRTERDLGHPLEWVAVVHRNTDHPHVHVALRGVTGDGHALKLSRDYVKQGVRAIAEELCTRQLGFRTSLDAAEAERREIKELRFTTLDRTLLRNSEVSEDGFIFRPESPGKQNHNPNVTSRLVQLQNLELAESKDDGSWQIKPEAEQVLRAMQRTKDRQRTLLAHGEPVSDMRLPIEVLNWRDMPVVEGRVLVHGQDEQSGKSYLMLESITAKIYYVPYTREMEEARSRGGLKANSFFRLRKMFDHGTSVEDLGTADSVLTNRPLLRENLRQLRLKGISPTEEGWGGWLGKYQKAICAEFEIYEKKEAKRREKSQSLMGR